jgi:hypothetical protein
LQELINSITFFLLESKRPYAMFLDNLKVFTKNANAASDDLFNTHLKIALESLQFKVKIKHNINNK